MLSFAELEELRHVELRWQAAHMAARSSPGAAQGRGLSGIPQARVGHVWF